MKHRKTVVDPASIRILFLTHDLVGRGANYIRAASLAAALQSLGHQVTVLAGRSVAAASANGLGPGGAQIVTFPDPLPTRIRRSGLSPVDAMRRLSFAVRGRFDVVQIYGFRPNELLPAMAARSRSSAKLIVDWSDRWGLGGIASSRRWAGKYSLGLVDHVAERWAVGRADGVLAATHHLAHLAIRWGLPDAKVRVIRTGADVERIRPLEKAAARKKIGLRVDGRVVVHSGLSTLDMPYLRGLFQAIHRRDPQAEFLLLGADRPTVARLSRGSQFAAQVRAIGYVPQAQMGELLACGDVMLLPLSGEGYNLARFPNRMGDFLAAGRPVVTNSSGEPGQFVQRVGSGLAVEDTPEAVAEAVHRLLEDRGLASEMGRRGRIAAEQELAWEHLTPIAEKFYQRLLGGSGQGQTSPQE